MATKKGLRRAQRAARPNKHQLQLLTMYSSEYPPTLYATSSIKKRNRRKKLAQDSRRRNK
ncbi:MAG: hypothetical protein ACXABY_06550 [Candidatus Thorarchaeota archaeon]|jgi:hypothetical protein